jgi:hypothetical protein
MIAPVGPHLMSVSLRGLRTALATAPPSTVDRLRRQASMALQPLVLARAPYVLLTPGKAPGSSDPFGRSFT